MMDKPVKELMDVTDKSQRMTVPAGTRLPLPNPIHLPKGRDIALVYQTDSPILNTTILLVSYRQLFPEPPTDRVIYRGFHFHADALKAWDMLTHGCPLADVISVPIGDIPPAHKAPRRVLKGRAGRDIMALEPLVVRSNG